MVFAAFLVLTALVWRIDGPVRLDRLTSRGLAKLGLLGRRDEGLLRSHRLSVALADLGSPVVVGGLALALGGLAVWWREREVAVLAVLGPACAGLLTELVAKPLIGRPAYGGGDTFPSGHAAGLAAVAMVAVVLVHRRRGRAASIPLAPLALVAVLAMGVSMVRLGRHYPTDIAGGLALGAIVVLGLTVLLSAVASKRQGTSAEATHLTQRP